VRRDCADYLFTGQRADVVRRTDGQLRYAQRLIVLDNTVLSASKISVFF
jgi:3-phenylpropionate/cinnamic acid dioxygenase small subunit